MRLLLALLISCIGKGVQGQCSGGLWPITDTTIGSLAVSWRYYLTSNTVQFIIQGQLASNIDLTSTYVAIGWSEAPPTINQVDMSMFFIGEETLQDRYTRTDAMPLIDEHQDFCVLQTNTTGQRIYVAFERLTTTDDIDDLSFLTRVNVMFLMGTYTRSNDTSPYDPQPPFFRKSLPSATHLIYCNATDCLTSNCSSPACPCIQEVSSGIGQCFCFPNSTCTSGSTLPGTKSAVSAILNGTCQGPSEPCSTHGICLQMTSSHFLCQCRPDHTGVLCQTPLFLSNISLLNPCPCVNRGVCLSDGSCTCSDLYRGEFCQLANPCHEYCHHDGVCTVRCNRSSCGQPSCACSNGFTGIQCDLARNICTPNPCLNGGTCHDDPATNSSHCRCPSSTTGSRCETQQSLCTTTLCFNDGICYADASSGNSTTRCLCSSGYTGRYCQTALIPQSACSQNPCGLNGTCIQATGASHYCICSQGLIGPSCNSTALTSCASSPCHYLSTCQQIDNSLSASYKCICPSYLTGDRCQYTSHCQKKPCLNQATCVSLGPQTSFTCLCSPGFGHYDCSIYLGLSCDANVCMNGGTCDRNGTEVRCICPAAFAGPRCEWISVCSSNTCQNGGTCRQIAPTMAECLCQTDFTGPTCSLRDSCAILPCKNGGGCTTLLADTGTHWSAYRCVCPPGIYGQNCDTPISSCATLRCSSYKVCSEQPTGPVCTCAGNKVGTFCQYDNPCSSSSNTSCQNGGTCMPSTTDPPTSSCLCPEGYMGTHCERIIEGDPCASNPCQTRGHCALSPSNKTYTCVCQDNFVGEQCERNNPCVSSPCFNQAVCQPGWNNNGTWYTCRCVGTFTGARCETSLLNPCGGLCMNGSPCNKGVCLCPAQYTGTFCGFDNPCYNPICQNRGVCSVVYNSSSVSYTCTCPSFYTGQHCETPLRAQMNDACSTPCKNGGTCKSGLCLCPSQYMGSFCEYDNPCVSQNPCLNGGTCFGRYDNNGTLSTQCNCLQGFTGRVCEATMCSSTSCNGGLCTATQNGLVCTCSAGQFGDRCQYPDACANKPCLNNERCEQLGSQYQCISCYDKSSYCSIYQLRNEYCDNRYTILVENNFLPVPQACQRSCGQCLPVQRLKDISSLFANAASINELSTNSTTPTVISNSQHDKCVDKRDDCAMQKAYGFCPILNEKYPDDCIKTCHSDCTSLT